MSFFHLVRRTFQSLDNSPLSPAEVEDVRGVLLPEEMDIWLMMQNCDKRHSVLVWHRFLAIRPGASSYEQRAALLHDVGKSRSRLGVLGRITATLVGPRTKELRIYTDHERIGRELLSPISHPRTLQVLEMKDDDAASVDLRAADNT